MWFTENKCLIPKQWFHDYNIKNVADKTLKDLIIQNQLPIPQEYKNEQNMTIFDKAYFGIIPDISDHKPEERDEQGFTVAMILAINNIVISQEWQHNPSIQNKYNWTTAMYISKYCKQIPDYCWNHDPTLYNNEKQTVAMLLITNKIMPPKQWQHNTVIKDIHGQTVAMYIQQYFTQSIPSQWYHDPIISDNNKNTIAMRLAQNKIIPSNQWYHSPILQNNQGQTVAMLLTQNNIDPPKQWYHNPQLQDTHKFTVAMYYATNALTPPEHWNHHPNIQNENNDTVASILIKQNILPSNHWINEQILQNQAKSALIELLNENGFIYKEKSIFKFKIQILNEICQICFTQSKQKFIQSKCGHKICLQCYKQLLKVDNSEKCPICRQVDWVLFEVN